MSRVVLYSLFLTFVTAAELQAHHKHGRGSHSHNQDTRFVIDGDGKHVRVQDNANTNLAGTPKKTAKTHFPDSPKKDVTKNFIKAVPKKDVTKNFIKAVPKKDVTKNFIKAVSLNVKEKRVHVKAMRRNRHQFRFKGQESTQMHQETKKSTVKHATAKAKESGQKKVQVQEKETRKSTMTDAKAKTKTSEQMKVQTQETKKKYNVHASAATPQEDPYIPFASAAEARKSGSVLISHDGNRKIVNTQKETKTKRKYHVHAASAALPEEDPYIPFASAAEARKSGSVLISQDGNRKIVRKERVHAENVNTQKDPTSSSFGKLDNGLALVRDCTKGMERTPSTTCPNATALAMQASSCESFYYEDYAAGETNARFKACRFTADNQCMWVGDTCNYEQLMSTQSP